MGTGQLIHHMGNTLLNYVILPFFAYILDRRGTFTGGGQHRLLEGLKQGLGGVTSPPPQSMVLKEALTQSYTPSYFNS
jgi:hypothetical protein